MRDMAANDGPLQGADPASAFRDFNLFDNPSVAMSPGQSGVEETGAIKLGYAPAPVLDPVSVDET